MKIHFSHWHSKHYNFMCICYVNWSLQNSNTWLRYGNSYFQKFNISAYLAIKHVKLSSSITLKYCTYKCIFIILDDLCQFRMHWFLGGKLCHTHLVYYLKSLITIFHFMPKHNKLSCPFVTQYHSRTCLIYQLKSSTSMSLTLTFWREFVPSVRGISCRNFKNFWSIFSYFGG